MAENSPWCTQIGQNHFENHCKDFNEENFDRQQDLNKFIKSKTAHHVVIDRRNGHNDIAKQLLEKLLPPLERLRDHLANKNLEFEDEMAHQMKFALDREERFVGRRELVDLMWWKINPIRATIGRFFISVFPK